MRNLKLNHASFSDAKKFQTDYTLSNIINSQKNKNCYNKIITLFSAKHFNSFCLSLHVQISFDIQLIKADRSILTSCSLISTHPQLKVVSSGSTKYLIEPWKTRSCTTITFKTTTSFTIP